VADGGLTAALAGLQAVGVDTPHTTTVLAAAALLSALEALPGGSVVDVLDVLDVGAGTGTLAALAQAAGGRALGLERDPALVAIGRTRHPLLELVVGEAPRDLPTGPFTVVVANLTDPPLRDLVPELVRRARVEVIVTGVRLWQGPALRRALERAGARPTVFAADGWCGYRARVGAD
jgi:ribosomal protein L11 methylase PrmA